jgi:hypothetical protein
VLLKASVSDDDWQVAVDLTNPDLFHGETLVLQGRLISTRAAPRAHSPTELTQVLAVENFSTVASRAPRCSGTTSPTSPTCSKCVAWSESDVASLFHRPWTKEAFGSPT